LRAADRVERGCLVLSDRKRCGYIGDEAVLRAVQSESGTTSTEVKK
jgi:hypothetical protein